MGKSAIVIGSGMAGLLAARVLADAYEQVKVLERDTFPSPGQPRKGVPQGRHAHALLARGQEILEELFPGLTQDLVEQGAIRGHGRFFSGGGYHQPVRQGPGGLFVSRPRLESEVRARLLVLPNVQLAEDCVVRGIVANEDRTRVIGVHAARRHALVDADVEPADLVVDASGRGSQAPSWLENLGFPKPEIELVRVGMGYSTRLYRRDLDHLDGDVVVNVAPAQGQTRACGMLAQEGNCWIVTLAGYFGDYPPTDDPGFLAFAKSLPSPDVYAVIRGATPLSDPVSFRFPANRRCHYEKLGRFPDGFLVIGDAICSFTPIYGQGMTVAAMEAISLRECLAEGTYELTQRFFKLSSQIVDIAWSITVGNDMRLSGRAESRGRMSRFVDWYMDKVQIAARHDARVALTFLRVANLIEAPSALLRPSVGVRVLRGNLTAMTHA